MNVALPAASTRHTRLTTLVSAAEAEQISQLAAAAGLSVSAWLRERALGQSYQPDEEAALRHVDALIDRMEANLDSAIAELTASLRRMDAAG